MTDQNTPNNGGWEPAGSGVPVWTPAGHDDLAGQAPGTVPGAPFQSPSPELWTPSPSPVPVAPADPQAAGASSGPQWEPPPPPTMTFPVPPTQPPSNPPPPGVSIPPPPTAGYNPMPVRGARYGGRYYRRGGLRGNGVYSIVAGAISILVVLGSLALNGSGHFTFLIFFPFFGLIYGIASITQSNRKVLGIIGTVLCAAALLLAAVLFFAG